MAGRIHPDDLLAVKERARIDEIVGERVQLRSAGVGSFKGLCPFHDERTPSFTVRPMTGRFRCFGCGESGDAIEFLMKIDGLGFADAVEQLALHAGIQVRYVDDGGRQAQRPAVNAGQRQRLLEMHTIAEAYYSQQLEAPGPAETARAFLAARGFSREDAARFGVGFAPNTGDSLLRQLRAKGFGEAELVTSGLAGQGQRGVYDRFRGRLVWPIRDVAGHTVAFGARRLFEDDRIESKYLNSPETPIYKKSQALYGLDLAKRDITRSKRVVVVEGYTDVMACHLSGVGSAVATCGTAFGEEHARIVQRMLGGDDGSAEVVFTFDGDAAGQKAAMKAYELDQKFSAQTYVAVAPNGQDPCDLRLSAGETAVAQLVEGRVPLFEFAIRSTIEKFDLDSENGRLAALDAAAPIVGAIRDTGLQQRYAINLDRWTGFLDERFVLDRVRRAASKPQQQQQRSQPVQESPRPVVDLNDPVVQLERRVLSCVLQAPWAVADVFDALDEDAFRAPGHRAVADAVVAAGGPVDAPQGPAWLAKVLDYATGPVGALVDELAATDLPVSNEDELERWARSLVAALAGQAATRAVADVRRALQRLDPSTQAEEYAQASAELFRLEAARRTWQERAAGL